MATRPLRRSRPSLARRLRTFWILGVVAIAAVAAGGWALVTWHGFHVGALTVTGLARVEQRDVLTRAAIDPHANIWLLDRGAIERRISAIPYVASAWVHRRPLASVWIEIAERTADACVRDPSGDAYTVDRDLRVLTDGCSAGTTRVYDLRAQLTTKPGAFLHDAELVRLHRDAGALATTGDRFRAFRHDDAGALEATLHDGIRVKFGDDGDLAVKQRLIAPILAQLGARVASVRAVDLRAPATPVVEYRSGPVVHRPPHRMNTI